MSTTPPHSPHPSSEADGSRRPKPREVLREINYPHGIHPALVPGIAVEDQNDCWQVHPEQIPVALEAVGAQSDRSTDE